MTGPTALIVNAGARSGADALAEVRAALAAAGVTVDEARVAEKPDALDASLREAVALRPARLLVGGGDGTISAAAHLLVRSEIVLGVVPLGTGNDFARNLRIPHDLAGACAVIARGDVREVTVGIANGRTFLNAVSFGISSAVSRRLTPELKRRAGTLAYPIAAAGEALAPEPFRVEVQHAGGRSTYQALQVVVGNGRYHGAGTLVTPDATIDDDVLDAYVVGAAGASAEGAGRAKNAWVLARVGALLRRGRHLDHDAVVHLRARELAFDATPPQEVNGDGEVLGTTPLACGIAPRALRVLAPPRRAGG